MVAPAYPFSEKTRTAAASTLSREISAFDCFLFTLLFLANAAITTL